RRVGWLVGCVRERQHAVGSAWQITIERPVVDTIVDQCGAIDCVIPQRNVVEDAVRTAVIAERSVAIAVSSQIVLLPTQRIQNIVGVALISTCGLIDESLNPGHYGGCERGPTTPTPV